MRPGAFGDFLCGVFVTDSEATSQNITLVDRVFIEHRLRQIDPASRRILGDVAQDVGQLQRLPKVFRVTLCRFAIATKNANAQKPHHRGRTMAVKFQFVEVTVPRFF